MMQLTRAYSLKHISNVDHSTEKRKKKTTYGMGAIVSNDATDKGLISRIYKQLTQFNSKKPTTQWKSGQKT